MTSRDTSGVGGSDKHRRQRRESPKDSQQRAEHEDRPAGPSPKQEKANTGCDTPSRKRSQRDGSGNAQGFQKWRSVGGRLPEAGTNAINSANKRRHADPRIATIPEKVTPQVRFAVIWRR
jgi:hypothetical protein